jgi:squalene-hopene/tetraprenyl-beta-curcumene cyclase
VHDEASRALARGQRFLLARQARDGLWRDFRTTAGEASEWPTGFIGAALHRAGAPTDATERAADALVARQNVDGGWAYSEDVPTDADSTASVLLFLALVGGREESCGRAATCLAGYRQAKTGGVATYREPGPIRRYMGMGRWMPFGGWCSPQTEVTALAGRALAAAGAAHDAAAAAWRYVRERQRPDGSWDSYWWTSSHYATREAVALARSSGDQGAVERAAAWAIRSQQATGAWSAPGAETSAFATALCLSTLVDAGGSAEPVGRAVGRATSALAALQQDDGGWPSHPIMRIPLPGDRHPGRHRPRLPKLSGGIVVRDQHRTFTSAACVAALACASAYAPDTGAPARSG